MDNTKKKILVAEDDEFLIKAYKAKLIQEGYEMSLATDGEKTLNLAKSEKPALILLDLMMPKMNGFEVLAALKADPGTQNIPVIITSNLGQEADVKKGIDAGAVDYLIKARFTMEELMEKLKKYLN